MKPASDLCAVPENEPLDSDTEAEQSLMERIKSIKQEKCVNVEEIKQVVSGPHCMTLERLFLFYVPERTLPAGYLN